MFKAAILRDDDSILLIRIEVRRNRGKRSVDGHWRGAFSVPTNRLRPPQGSTIRLKFDDGSSALAVVAGIGEQAVYFRAEGRPPRPLNRRSSPQAALAGT